MIEDIEKKMIFKQWSYAIPRGWHNLFWDMLERVQEYMNKYYPHWMYDIIDVKEKYSTLTVYDCCYDENGNYKDVPKEVMEIARSAFEKSKYICPVCGGEKEYKAYEFMCPKCLRRNM